MKKTLLSAALIAGFGVAAFAPQAANASDGTITFSGKVVAQTCTIAINGGTASPTVALPTVSTTAFTGAGTTAGWSSLTFALSGCTAATGTSVVPYFEQGATTTAAGYLKNTVATGGANVAIILSTDGTTGGKIDVSKAAGSQVTTAASLATATAVTFNYYAGYVANAATTTAGNVASTVTYSLSYN